jgi:ABC-type nitrate/sulfonate/bicarbonate transport system substrate-binding protein
MTFLLLIAILLLPVFGRAQNAPKVRMAYTSINIQMTPIYLMKDLDLARKQGLDAAVLMIPVSSRAIHAALASGIRFMSSGGVVSINANMSGGDFFGITSTISTFVFKIIGQSGIKEPSQLKGKRVAISRLGGASDFYLRYALDRWE